MVELRLLTEKAKQTRYDFVWEIAGHDQYPWLVLNDAETALRRGLEAGLRMHGALDYGLGPL